MRTLTAHLVAIALLPFLGSVQGGPARAGAAPTQDLAPSSPMALRVDTHHHGVGLQWGAALDDASTVTYRAEWSADGVNFGELASTDGLSVRDAEAPAHATIWYRVFAIDAAGHESAPAGPVMVEVPAL